MMRSLNVAEVAAEMGRSTQWVYTHWRRLAAKEGMPMPVRGEDPPLMWSAAQFYAWLDRDLPEKLKASAAAFRAAAAAYVNRDDANEAADIDAARAELDRRFSRKEVA